MKLVALAVVLAAAPASASTVLALSPDQLRAGADRVVDGTIVARTTIWNATHTGLETHAMLADDAGVTVELVVPGGELDGGRHIIVGMPSAGVGERARWFLKDRGDGTYRVYGWAQGKWPAKVTDGVERFAPDPVAAEHDAKTIDFVTNGMVWPATKIPVQYYVQNAGSADLALPDEIAAIDAAFGTWQSVACAGIAYQNAGMTDLGLAIDGTNVILFLESGWTFGDEAAAATSLFIIDGQQTADIAVNGQDFMWAISPPSNAIDAHTLDLQAVLTHEIGHFTGLGHSMRAFDTMYYSWTPWQSQRTLSPDDRLGACSIYPVMADECPPACAPGQKCVAHPLGTLCEADPDPVGTPCNYDRVECDAFCLFTAADLSTGYCSKFCTTDRDCPLTHHCAQASAGTMTVNVCFSGAQPPPTCSDDTCPAGQHCDDTATCTFECRVPSDCGPSATCDAHGYCVQTSGGCCQGEPGRPPLILVGLVALVLRRRLHHGRHVS
jgi:Matrixin